MIWHVGTDRVQRLWRRDGLKGMLAKGSSVLNSRCGGWPAGAEPRPSWYETAANAEVIAAPAMRGDMFSEGRTQAAVVMGW